MEIVIFILLAGVWAMLLIPSFFDSRRQAPINTTQDFAKNTARLNAVRVLAAEPAAAHRRRMLARRRRTLLSLVAGAMTTLALAIVTGSILFLGLNLIVDMALAAYIAMLLQIKEVAGTKPPVRLPVGPQQQAEDDSQAKIRILAG